MQTFDMFFREDAGDKFNKMDDSQFDDWKKKNPGAAKKADELRKSAAQKSGGAPAIQKKELPTSAITKPGAPSIGGAPKPTDYKATLKNAAVNRMKQLAADGAKKAGGALVKSGKDKINGAIRKSEMGKWSQGAKTAPKGSAMTSADKPGALVPTAQKSASGSAGEPELKGQQAKDAKEREERGTYRKMRDAVRGGLQDVEDAKAAKEAEANKKKGGFAAGFKKSMGGDYFHSDDEKRRAARNQLGQKVGKGVKDAPGKAAGALARFLARGMKSSVGSGSGPTFGGDLQGLRQR